MNPLLTPFDTAPFSRIKNEHFMPAFQQGHGKCSQRN